jgi:magnesium transporter
MPPAVPETGRHADRAPAVVAWLFQEGKASKKVALDELGTLAASDERFVWVDLSGYSEADMQAVAQQLHLPEAATGAALAASHRPRVSIFGDCFFVAVVVPHSHPDAKRVHAGELDLFVGRNFLVSAHKHPLPFAARVLERAVQNPALLKLDSAFLLSILIDEALAHFEELAEAIEDDIEAMEERALTDLSDAFLADLLELKRYVFAVYRLAGQNRAVIAAFLRPDFPLAGGDAIVPYFRDLQDRFGRLLDGLESAKEAVNGAFDLYVSQVSRRTNDIMKVLAVVSAVLLPTTVILGFFGTSFQDPPIASPDGFVIMAVLIVFVTLAILYLFYRWQWVGGGSTGPPDRWRQAHRSKEKPT